MSYFAIVAGPIDAVAMNDGYLVPVQEAQYYVAGLEESLSKVDGHPLLFWDDGETSTSTNVVCEAEEMIQNGDRPEDTAVGRLICLCASGGHGLRIWWAGNDPDDHLRVESVSTEVEALALIRSQILARKDIALHLLKNRK